MKKSVLIFLLIFILLFFGIVGPSSAKESGEDILISKNVLGNYETSIDGDNIVWSSGYDEYSKHSAYKDAVYRIIHHNITSGSEEQIPVKGARPGSPVVSGRYIIWSDSVSGSDTGYDIYCYDLNTKITKVISDDYGDQITPVAAEDIIVWCEHYGPGRMNSKIGIYNISDESSSEFSFPSEKPSVMDTNGRIILYTKSNLTSYRIFCHNISTNEKTIIYENRGSVYSLSTSGERAAWIEAISEGNINYSYSMVFYNLSSGEADILKTENISIDRVKTDDSIAVYEYGSRAAVGEIDGSQIYYYDYGKKEAFLLTKRDGNQCSPSVSGGKVVWQDNSEDKTGIYLHYYYGAEELESDFLNSSEYLQKSPEKNAKTSGFIIFDALLGLTAACLVIRGKKE